MVTSKVKEVVGIKNTKIMRVPIEFDKFIIQKDKEFSEQTGFASNKVATMRRMARKFDKKVVVRGVEFDWVVFGK